MRVEVLACDAPSPTESYLMAHAVQAVLGGESMRWSAHVDLLCGMDDKDLQLYFSLMSSPFEHKELLGSHRSNFSDASIWRIDNHVKLMLNNIIMSDSTDEHIYHEVLVQPALLAAEQPRRALIIGG